MKIKRRIKGIDEGKLSPFLGYKKKAEGNFTTFACHGISKAINLTVGDVGSQSLYSNAIFSRPHKSHSRIMSFMTR